MRKFKTKKFTRDAKKLRLNDAALLEAANRGSLDAHLGGGIVKQRIARAGQGKSGGFRSIIVLKPAKSAFFVFVFAKKERDNVTRAELAEFKQLASELFNLDDAALTKGVAAGLWSRYMRKAMKKAVNKRTKKKYRSPIMAAIHETVEDLHAAGVVDKTTLRRFDETCLTPVRQLSPAKIRRIREREGASQAVFARYLNVSTGIVSQWERGEKHPAGASLKLLTIIDKKGLLTIA